LIKDTQKERNLFVAALDKCRDEIHDFESLLNEQRSVHDANMLNHRQEISKTMTSLDKTLIELHQDRQQLKTMVKNQNYHCNELQKLFGTLNYRTTEVEKIAARVPGIQKQLDQTDIYLNLY
jgi:septal ring factor EnvC (AmiA/AmiB activator)